MSTAMRRILVFQHVPHEILGTLDPLLRDAGFRIRYVNFSRQGDSMPDVGRYHGLIVLGGPMNCDEVDRYPHLAIETDSIRAAIERGMPVLGICLGAQLIARALDARVTRNPEKEIGWYDVTPTPEGAADPLFNQFSGTEKIFQWHGDTFDIPQGAVHLARSDSCANQAFRYGDNVYALQFHLEVDEPLIMRWLHTPVMAREIECLGPAFDPARISADTHQYIGRSLALGQRFFRHYIETFHQRRRRVLLSSRHPTVPGED
ncbi:MAG: gamma-glutamyl-gamma-aminobutyrate hydrolase family protein [Gammaproteobacteria bacterium]|nr:gamma-glutamyl-gamma-aminobutyrate hydrolase family protein [Gammaproteobacteria bacterium]